MRRYFALVLLCIAPLLTSCGERDGARAAGPTKESSATPSVSTATVDQYASIVARSASDVHDQFDSLSTCDWAGPSGLDEPGSITCSAGVLSLSYVSQALVLDLQAAPDEAAPGYVGSPPAEMESLVSETLTKFNQLAKSVDALTDASCARSGQSRCQRLQGQVFQKMNSAESTLDAWGPYLS